MSEFTFRSSVVLEHTELFSHEDRLELEISLVSDTCGCGVHFFPKHWKKIHYLPPSSSKGRRHSEWPLDPVQLGLQSG